jgi:hypothetical protein
MSRKLTQEEMNADFGNTYIELKSEYPTWSRDLHEKGHILDEEKLKKIFCRGLLLWYIRYCLKITGLNLFNSTHYNYTSFYEVTTLIRFFNEVKPNIVDSSLIDLLTYENYQMLMLTDKVKPCASFSIYSYMHNLNEHIDKLVTEKQRFDKIFESLFKSTQLESFVYSDLIETHIVKLGIVFQRWKIVLEQMCSKSNGKDDQYMRDIYLIDRFLVAIQEMILMHIKMFVQCLKESFNNTKIEKFQYQDIYKNVKCYKLIYENIISSDVFFKQIKDPENLDNELIKLIESFFV